MKEESHSKIEDFEKLRKLGKGSFGLSILVFLICFRDNLSCEETKG
jgi:hypothetical protein